MLYLYTGLGMPDRYQPPREAFDTLGTFPHCDGLILHRPTTCSYCDAHPDWQALREVWEINFTGEADPQKAPCPSVKYRPAYQAHRWPGNRPTNVDVETRPPTAWAHLNDDTEDG